MRYALFLLAGLAVMACGDDECEADDDAICDAGCDPVDPDCCDDDDGMCYEDEVCDPPDADCADPTCEMVTVEGTAVELLAPTTPAPEGLCIYAVDAAVMLGGGQPEAGGVVGANGAFSIADLEVNEFSIGYAVLIADCPGDGPTVMPTGTGLEAPTVNDTAYPECVVSDVVALNIDLTTMGTFQALLAAAGYTGDLAADGMMVGFARDASGNPMDGVMVSGAATVYYFIGTGFSTESGTVAAAGGIFVVPGAELGEWTCAADGYTFETMTAGTIAGYALIAACDAM